MGRRSWIPREASLNPALRIKLMRMVLAVRLARSDKSLPGISSRPGVSRLGGSCVPGGAKL